MSGSGSKQHVVALTWSPVNPDDRKQREYHNLVEFSVHSRPLKCPCPADVLFKTHHYTLIAIPRAELLRLAHHWSLKILLIQHRRGVDLRTPTAVGFDSSFLHSFVFGFVFLTSLPFSTSQKWTSEIRFTSTVENDGSDKPVVRNSEEKEGGQGRVTRKNRRHLSGRDFFFCVQLFKSIDRTDQEDPLGGFRWSGEIPEGFSFVCQWQSSRFELLSKPDVYYRRVVRQGLMPDFAGAKRAKLLKDERSDPETDESDEEEYLPPKSHPRALVLPAKARRRSKRVRRRKPVPRARSPEIAPIFPPRSVLSSVDSLPQATPPVAIPVPVPVPVPGHLPLVESLVGAKRQRPLDRQSHRQSGDMVPFKKRRLRPYSGSSGSSVSSGSSGCSPPFAQSDPMIPTPPRSLPGSQKLSGPVNLSAPSFESMSPPFTVSPLLHGITPPPPDFVEDALPNHGTPGE